MFRYFIFLIPLFSWANVYEVIHKGNYVRIENMKSKIMFSSQYINESIRKNKCSSGEIETFVKEMEENFNTALISGKDTASGKVDKKTEMIKISKDGVVKEFSLSTQNAVSFLQLQDGFVSMQTRIKRKCIP
ncbi:MAG: hypothetical protein JNL11_02705 [Bdellovibrionaceae bacterium]|nr:hypothetical protein [Pseudobdellovibrionaceae bacterium]